MRSLGIKNLNKSVCCRNFLRTIVIQNNRAMFRRLFISNNRKLSISIFNVRHFSDSVTYSGGHANYGQGGFYASGGSRVVASIPDHNPRALASQQDILELARIYADVENLESQLRAEGTAVNSKTIELRSMIQKMVKNPKVLEILNRLEIKGEPVWGLSSQERDLVRVVRRRYNA
jgi:hypothetical protein